MAGMQAAGSERFAISDTHEPGEIQRVKVVMEARGQITAEDGKTTYPMSATAQMVYQERWYSAGSPRTSVRHYEKALARLKVGESADEVVLPIEKQTVVVNVEPGSAAQMYAPGQHLSRRELDAIRIPGNSLLLSGMLPKEPVQAGDMWTPDAASLAGILQLDEVTGPEVRCKLVEVDRGLAKIQFSGQIVGRVDGATTGMELSGELRCDVGTQRVRWIQLKLHEDRDAGPASPAFKAVAEIRMLLESLPAERQASFPAVLKPMTPEDTWLEFVSSEGGFRFLHDPNWTIVADRGKTTILRWMEAGRVIIQCNISRLPNLAAGKQLGLEELQADLRKSFGDEFGEFELAKQDVRQDGTQVLRVVANGEVDGGRVLWIFCHLATAQGDRASMILTMDAAGTRQHQQADKLLVESLQFFAPQTKSPLTPPANGSAEQATRRATATDTSRR
jgi:hypothetical protein